MSSSTEDVPIVHSGAGDSSVVSERDVSSIIGAIDNHTPKQFGEKGHVEYGWSNKTKEKLLQVFFQMVRASHNGFRSRSLRGNPKSIGENPTTKHCKEFIETHFRPLLEEAIRLERKAYNDDNKEEWSKAYEILRVLFLMTIHARDIEEGKGERSFAYSMIYEWFKVSQRTGMILLRSLVYLKEEKEDGTEIETHPLGSWKDLKYFSEFVFREYKIKRVSVDEVRYSSYKKNLGMLIANEVVDLYVKQLLKDLEELERNPETKNLSLVARWVPREKSAFSWLFHQISETFYYENPRIEKHTTSTERPNVSLETSETSGKTSQYVMSLRGMYASYLRKTLSKLNKALNTPQVNMCDHSWSEIDFKNVTSLTMKKYRNAFLNVKKGRAELQQRSTEIDRVECAEHLKTFMEKAKEGKVEVHGKRLTVGDFVKEALKTIDENNKEGQELINLQWTSFMKQIVQAGNIIPLADVSGSMEGDPMMYSIGFSIMLSEIASKGFKNRIMTFETKPSWVKLDDSMSFVEKVKIVHKAPWGGTTNFYAALKMILNSCVENSVPNEVVKNLVLAIFSDMQIDVADSGFAKKKDTLFEGIRREFVENGYTNIPHILFWNLRSTSGFPSLSSTENTTMLSGFSASLMNDFSKRGMEAIREYSPYESMVESFEKKRYSILEREFQEIFHFPIDV